MTTPTDAELVERCRAGDESAWVLLTERYADLVFGVARRCGVKATEAGDVVQEVFLGLFRHLGRLRRKESLLAWILKVAQREAWAHVKRTRKRGDRESGSADGVEATGRLPAGALAALEDEQVVRAAYGAIGERCRRLLDALFIREPRLPYTEVAEQLGMKIGSIGPTRARCLEELRHELVRLGFVPPEGTPTGGCDPDSGRKRA